MSDQHYRPKQEKHSVWSTLGGLVLLLVLIDLFVRFIL